jgi:signal transduction histidine kinase/DNA-binding response OmpR family regulator
MRDPTRLCFLFFFLFLILSYQTFPQTHIHEGNVHGKWLKQNSPYYIDGEIKIPYDKKLVIEPGVKIIFTGHYKFIVNGILEAKGNEKDSIYFFPSDTAIGWHGIRFIEAEDFSELEYCVLKYGKTIDKELMKKALEQLPCPPTVECGNQLDLSGGAIYVNKSNPVISRSKIINNVAGWGGGGIEIINNSNPIIRYCQITNNRARDGAAIKCTYYSNPLIKNCYLAENSCGMGGGIFIGNYSNAMIDSCIIQNNNARNRGGGISFYTSAKPIVKNSIISDNSSSLGGGIYIDEFYNEFREQPEKIDIRITTVKIENNSADYGGGIWVRDTQGELSGVTICNNKAMFGGGIHIEHNPHYLKFSSKNPCNIYMNFARMMGNDLFRLGGDNPIEIQLDTFTVKYYSSLNAEPVEKFLLTTKNFKLTQVDANLYVNPDGNDSNSGLSSDDPLKSLKIALLKILSDSTSPRTIYMNKGEYIFTETNDVIMLAKHKYVSLNGMGFSDVIIGTDRITVLTPWWITTWALIIYISTLISVIVIIWNVRMKRVKINSELERQRFEAEKLHEVNELKSHFFTNISHEFRTPLTLILGPVKQMIEKLNEGKMKDDLSMVHRSAKKLNRLVDELLDISKIESGEMKLKTCPLNLVTVINELAFPFYSLAESKNLTFKFKSDLDEIITYIDKDKFDKILTNVLSNAFKFTPEGGKVELGISCKEKNVEIIINDTGVGIPKAHIDRIFDRFYQVDGSHTRQQEGTGIGLALTKDLIGLHKGKIEVESEESKGTIFRLIFPLGKDHLRPEEICNKEDLKDLAREKVIVERDDFIERKEKHFVDIESSQRESKPSLLIVEDNSDVRKYISSILENHYHIIEAKDGEEGLDRSFNHIPDLIISDIMMPKMDGFQLCNKLKTDSRTSHIPVIMLTAKATINDKINGLEIGADDYLIKPFEAEELKARIKNLLEQRKRLHEHFCKYGLVEIEEQNMTSLDQKFIQKSIEVINNNLSDTNLSVEFLSSHLSTSKSVLNKKLSALTGDTPAEFIKRLRLSKAAKLIEHSTGNISEIALEVGFSNPAYFAECFKKQFGISPSQYHNHSGNS